MKAGAMNKSQRLALMVIAGATALLPSRLCAAAVDAEIGPTSRASIQIHVSVAPRMGVRKSTARGDQAQGTTDALCVWSSTPSQSFTATLHAASGESGRASISPSISADQRTTLLPEGRAIALVAEPSASACFAESARRLVPEILLREERGPYLLVLAPQ